MNNLHALKFPKASKPAEKKVVDYLYIDADEDHVSLQFKEQKGDLEKGENGWKNNCVLVKLVYVYEGVEPEAPRSKRHRLVNPHYFSGVYNGADNQRLWDEVYEYMDSYNDLSKVKKIYLNADGGGWIQAGVKRISGVTSVLDEFHLSKYMLKLTSHMLDSAEDARKELYAALKEGKKAEFRRVVEKIDGCAQNDATKKRVAESSNYILSNWAVKPDEFAPDGLEPYRCRPDGASESVLLEQRGHAGTGEEPVRGTACGRWSRGRGSEQCGDAGMGKEAPERHRKICGQHHPQCQPADKEESRI